MRMVKLIGHAIYLVWTCTLKERQLQDLAGICNPLIR